MNDPDPFAPPVPRDVTPRTGYTFDPVQPIPEHMQPAPPPPMLKRALKDVNSAETAFKFRIFAWTAPGGFFGAVAGSYILPYKFIGVFVGAIVGWFGAYIAVTKFADGAAAAGGSLYFSSGKTTPGDRQYSLGQSYVARGLYDKAAVEYERNAAQYPDDPEPCMRLARLFRDELQRPHDAIAWFKRTSAISEVPAGTDMLAMREMIEIYTHNLHDEKAALPHLARLAAKHADAPAGIWAKQQIAAIKAAMREQQEQQEPS